MFYQQLSDIITTSPGNLTYHLVTSFAIIWAFQAAWSRWSVRRSQRSLRLVLGFGALMLLRLAVFGFATFVNQEAGALSLLPPVDRALSLIGLIIIVWMWAYPERSRSGDALLVLLILVDAAFLAVNLIGWQGHDPDLTFNASLLSPIWEGVSAFVCAAGMLLLASRRTRNWGFGFAILFVNFCGHIISLTAPILASNYPAAVRIAQFITYPLLYTLAVDMKSQAERRPSPAEESPAGTPDTADAEPSFRFPARLYDLVELVDLEDAQLFPALIKSLCGIMEADAGLLISPAESDNQSSVLGIYSPIKGKLKIGDVLTIKNMPLVFHALQRKRAIILPAENNAQDLATLREAFSSGQNPHTLSIPLLDQGGGVRGCVLLLRRRKSWLPVDQEPAQKAASFCYLMATRTLTAGMDLQKISQEEVSLDGLEMPGGENAEKAGDHAAKNWALLWEKAEKLLRINQQLRTALTGMAKENHRLQSFSAAERNTREARLATLFDEVKSRENTLGQVRTREQELSAIILALEEKVEQAEARERELRDGLESLSMQNESRLSKIKRLEEQTTIIPGLARRETELLDLLARIKVQNQELIDALQTAEKEAQKDPGMAQLEKKMRTALAQVEARARERNQQTEERLKSVQSLETRLAELEQESERKDHEAEELKSALAKANKALEKISRSEQKAQQAREQISQITGQQMSEIASSVQELRYPLSTIVDYSDLVLDESVGPLGALQKKFLERLKEGVTQLEAQIDLVVQTIVMDSTRLSLNIQKFDVQPLADLVHASLQDVLREKSISLEVTVPDEPLVVHTDKTALEKIMLILTQHACAVTPAQGKVKLELARAEDEQKKACLLVRVTDGGESIPPEEIPLVFTPAYQSARRTIGGSGDGEVGLPVARTLTEAIHGNIWVDSEAGLGSRFSALIPLKAEEGEDHRQH